MEDRTFGFPVRYDPEEGTVMDTERMNNRYKISK